MKDGTRILFPNTRAITMVKKDGCIYMHDKDENFVITMHNIIARKGYVDINEDDNYITEDTTFPIDSDLWNQCVRAFEFASWCRECNNA